MNRASIACKARSKGYGSDPGRAPAATGMCSGLSVFAVEASGPAMGWVGRTSTDGSSARGNICTTLMVKFLRAQFNVGSRIRPGLDYVLSCIKSASGSQLLHRDRTMFAD
ncbi:hypothetical protein [Bradyrhizobium sp. RP6]|uniref:hypothetical protein n=1 Tax=Bradyrhizobium sp. RP6 TaxID=2489596 RepID=UPI001FDF81C1|nr:hypothetical protein [Bradyrhizobium sp. RP6]